ncbi:hypothetical protein QM012_001508 [Aureobasidium pullulans]|uniref:Uncharacterized protein n=1 Tax=Aureobasidium pullulans TaxID=5580 RepID=A0ABR0TE99_AURPU
MAPLSHIALTALAITSMTAAAPLPIPLNPANTLQPRGFFEDWFAEAFGKYMKSKTGVNETKNLLDNALEVEKQLKGGK